MKISIKYHLGDYVWFFRSGNKVNRFSELEYGRIINVYFNVVGENIITYVIENIDKEIFYIEEDLICSDLTWVSMVAKQSESIQKDKIKKAYEALGKALGLV